ncbi:MAG: PA3496 family putative envelope integrity protein [Psychrobium sp.]
MRDINDDQTQDIIYDSAFEVTESSRKRSSVAKRRAIRARIDEINEQRELRRLIEEEWDH